MKNTIKIFIALFLALTTVGCNEEFLEVPPIDKLTDETYWSNEDNVRTFAYGFYPKYFVGYSAGWGWGSYFTGQSLNDDFAPSGPSQFVRNVPSSGGGWSFAWARKANIFIDRVQDVPMSEEAVNHWTGVGRFFRALEYHDLVKRFGDVPWFDQELSEVDNESLYKPRDPRTFVMDKVLADLKFAAEHVRENDGANGLTLNKDVVLAFMSRVMLFEGTWQKYHENDAGKAKEYLEEAKWAASEVISAGKYSLGNYREVFNSLNLSGNPEVLLFRQYEPGVLTHTLNSYNNKEPQTGVSKDAVENYLAADGLPIGISSEYKGDDGIEDVMANRDPRMHETLVPYELRLSGIAFNYSTSGYATHKFLNESIKDEPEGSSLLNPTDAPVIRYGEVLINYAEAVTELATVGGPALSQLDLDISVNVLRSRPGVDMPHLEVSNAEPAVDGTVYDDPERDQTVPSIIWEIRRERRVELMMEGFRLDDLKRWKKLEYTDTKANVDINRGAWVRKSDYPDANLTSMVLTEGEEGYIIPAWKEESQREFVDPKVYLYPLPLDQIKLYADQGYELKQNPGWE
jgi:hypothetical protein